MRQGVLSIAATLLAITACTTPGTEAEVAAACRQMIAVPFWESYYERVRDTHRLSEEEIASALPEAERSLEEVLASESGRKILGQCRPLFAKLPRAALVCRIDAKTKAALDACE